MIISHYDLKLFLNVNRKINSKFNCKLEALRNTTYSVICWNIVKHLIETRNNFKTINEKNSNYFSLRSGPRFRRLPGARTTWLLHRTVSLWEPPSVRRPNLLFPRLWPHTCTYGRKSRFGRSTERSWRLSTFYTLRTYWRLLKL